jgi:phosphotriesterase-related protein
MTTVETIRGQVDSAELGTTLMHEHVFVLNADIQVNQMEEWNEEARVADAVKKLTELKEIGVDTIVDPTVIGLGRYIPRIQKINEQVDINIIPATGVYSYDDVGFYFHFRGPALDPSYPDPMVDMFVKDITVGIADTGVKAAFLKCAIDAQGMTPGVERIMRAVSKAHRQTGVPITIHTHPGSQQGLAVKKVLGEEGVDLSRVVLGHSGDSTDADHLTALAEAGFILGMDRFGIDVILDFESRVNIVAELCRRGLASSMVLSQDTSCYIDWIDPVALPQMLPNWVYTHIHRDVLPALKKAGVSEEDINTMLVTNPRRYFENVGSY